MLIPVVDHGEAATVLLTKRAETLRSHTGQVAFPGGRIDPEDGSPEYAALREARKRSDWCGSYRGYRTNAGLCLGERLPDLAGAFHRQAGFELKHQSR